MPRSSAQEAGLPGYPVFTHKAHTDQLPGLRGRADRAAGRDLPAVRHAQRAGHAGGSYCRWRTRPSPIRAAAPVMAWARHLPRVQQDAPYCARARLRPGGEHRDLLAYLVRRLLRTARIRPSCISCPTPRCRWRNCSARLAAGPSPGLRLPVQPSSATAAPTDGLDSPSPRPVRSLQTALHGSDRAHRGRPPLSRATARWRPCKPPHAWAAVALWPSALLAHAGCGRTARRPAARLLRPSDARSR